jgi:4-methyl-5(b-hydroxyethyl)-thiazole monophosphate biosynthesis
MAKVYIFLSDGFEEIEGLTVVDLLRRVNIEIKMVSITGSLAVTGSHNITVMAEALFEDLDYQDADMLVLPGGLPGTTYLEAHKGLDQLLRDFANQGKMISAICAAPRVLGSKGLLNGRRAICYPGHEAVLVGATLVDSVVVEDDNIITSKGMGTAIDFSLAIIRKLKGAEDAINLARAIQYKHYEE